jgi:hypothetical protein
MSGASTPPSPDGSGPDRVGPVVRPGAPAAKRDAVAGGAIAAAAAVVVNLVIWGLGRAAGVDFEVTQPNGSLVVVGAGAVISQSLTGVIAGTLLLWPLTRLPAGLLVWVLGAALVGSGRSPSRSAAPTRGPPRSPSP